MLIKFKLSGLILVVLLLVQFQFSFADAFKRDIFILGIQLGGAETTASIHKQFLLADKPGALNLIKRNIKWSIGTFRRIGNPVNSLVKLESDLNKGEITSFEQLHTRLYNIIQEIQKQYEVFNIQMAGLFVLGVHLEGAECIASGVEFFPIEKKPGSYKLIHRNVMWLHQDLQNLNIGLNNAPLKQLLKELDQGVSFSTILERLEKIRLAWQNELEKQAPF